MVSTHINMPPKQKNNKNKQKKNKPQPKRVSARSKVINAGRKSTTNNNPRSTAVTPFAYTKALTDPFSPSALGARVPDMYAAPTNTLHKRGRCTMDSNINGNFSFIWIGSPFVSMWIPYSTQLINSVNTVVTSTDNSCSRVGSTPCYSTTTNVLLGAVSASHRMVGNGITITSNQPPLNMKGRIITARVPLGKDFWSAAQMTYSAPYDTAIMYKLCGISSVSDGVDQQVPTSIRDLQGSAEYSAAELTGCKAYCINKPMSPRAFDFNITNDSAVYNANYNEGDAVLVSSLGVTAGGTLASEGALGQANDCDNDGWTCILVRGEGFHTSQKAVVTIDMMTHLEVTPQIQAVDTSGVFVPDSVPNIPIVGALDKILNMATKMPVSTLISTAAKVALRLGY